MLRASLSKPFLVLAFLEALIFSFRADSLFWHIAMLLSLLSLAGFILIHWLRRNKAWALLILPPILILLGLRSQFHFNRNHRSDLKEKMELCSVMATVLNSENSQERLKLTIHFHHQGRNYKTLIQTAKESLPEQYEPGDQILISGMLAKIQACSHYDEYQYDNYLLDRHYQYKNLGPVEIEAHHKQGRLTFQNWACRSKSVLEEKIIKMIRDERISGVLLALLLGDKGKVDHTIRDQFMNTGTAHILAVSGLHLGILYSIIRTLLQLLTSKFTLLKSSQSLITLIVIWSFAAVTGLSSAVVRAALMFTTLELGRQLKRDSDPINLLGCSAFFMMFFNPCILFDVGFQLSVVAVGSIILFEPAIYRQIRAGSGWQDYFIKIVSVSLAVQILITPVSMYYFRSFPVYFILSNLVWIPLSFILMTSCMAMLLLLPCPQEILRMISSLTVALCDGGLQFFDFILRLPFSNLQNLYIFPEQVFLFMLSLTLILAWIQQGFKKYLKAGLILFSLTGLIYPLRSYLTANSNEIVIYKNNANRILEIKSGRILYSIMKPIARSTAPSLYAAHQSVAQIQNIKVPETKAWLSELTTPKGRKVRILYNTPEPGQSKFFDILYLENQKYFNPNVYDCGEWDLIILSNKNSKTFRKKAFLYFHEMKIQTVLLEEGTCTTKF